MGKQVSHKALWILATLVVVFAVVSTILVFSVVDVTGEGTSSSSEGKGENAAPVQSAKVQVFVVPENSTVEGDTNG